jgi:hypothetical protein
VEDESEALREERGHTHEVKREERKRKRYFVNREIEREREKEVW